MGRDYEALLRFTAERRRMPFRWGSNRNNCVTAAARAVEAQTGWNPLGDLRWRSLREGRQILSPLGGLEAAVDARMTRIAPAMAQRGDVAGVADTLLGIRLMIVEGPTLVGPGRDGEIRVPRSEMVAAWSADRPQVEAA